MIEVPVQDGYYIVVIPKAILVMTKAEFIQALRRGKWWKRRQARQARRPSAEGPDAPDWLRFNDRP